MKTLIALAALLGGTCLAGLVEAAPAPTMAPEATEYYAPVPPVVTPGDMATASPPSDAIVLFDGRNLDAWVTSKDKSPPGWKVEGGVLTVVKSAGSIETKQKFKDFQIHVEWKIPADITGSGQSRGNSGVFLASTLPGDTGGYEFQIVDSYQAPTYVNGQAGSVYKQSIPLVNPARKPGEWQAYDIIWTAPRWNPDGSLISPAKVTALFNGVLVQNDFVMTGETTYTGIPSYDLRPYDTAPIRLQAHADPSAGISYRNIWLRPLNGPNQTGDKSTVRMPPAR
jgi:hypothetical protein